jgi:hypothetical protein
VLFVVLVYALFLLRLKKSIDPAQVLYLRFCRKLARTGLARAPHEGSHAFAKRVTHQRADLATSVSEITGIYEDLRYGRAAPDRKKFILLKRRIAVFRV